MPARPAAPALQQHRRRRGQRVHDAQRDPHAGDGREAETPAPSFESTFLLRQGTTRRIEVTSYSFMSIASMVVNTERIASVHRRLARVAQQSLPVTLLGPRSTCR